MQRDFCCERRYDRGALRPLCVGAVVGTYINSGLSHRGGEEAEDEHEDAGVLSPTRGNDNNMKMSIF